MTSPINVAKSTAVMKAELRHKKREGDANRNLEYFKAGMDTIKPIIASKPFIAIGGSLILYRLEQADYIDTMLAITLATALTGWLAADAIEALVPF